MHTKIKLEIFLFGITQVIFKMKMQIENDFLVVFCEMKIDKISSYSSFLYNIFIRKYIFKEIVK